MKKYFCKGCWKSIYRFFSKIFITLYQWFVQELPNPIQNHKCKILIGLVGKYFISWKYNSQVTNDLESVLFTIYNTHFWYFKCLFDCFLKTWQDGESTTSRCSMDLQFVCKTNWFEQFWSHPLQKVPLVFDCVSWLDDFEKQIYQRFL